MEFEDITDRDYELYDILKNFTYTTKSRLLPEHDHMLLSFYHNYMRTKTINMTEFMRVCEVLIYSYNIDNIIDFMDRMPEKFKRVDYRRILMRVMSYFIANVNRDYKNFGRYKYYFDMFIARNLKPDDKWIEISIINYITDINEEYLVFLDSKSLIQSSVFSKIFYNTRSEKNLEYVIRKITRNITFNHMKFSLRNHSKKIIDLVFNNIFTNLRNYEYYNLAEYFANDITKINIIISNFKFPKMKSDFITCCFNYIVQKQEVDIIRTFYFEQFENIKITNEIIANFIISDKNRKLDFLFEIYNFTVNPVDIKEIDKYIYNYDNESYITFRRRLGGL